MVDPCEQETFDEMFADCLEVDGFGNARVLAKITDGEMTAYGYNSKKSHPFQKHFGTSDDNIYLHAEIDVIKNWIKFGDVGNFQRRMHDFIGQMEECDMYIMRVKRASRNGPWITGLSKPCLGCRRAIATFGIGCVYYTEDNAKEFTCL